MSEQQTKQEPTAQEQSMMQSYGQIMDIINKGSDLTKMMILKFLIDINDVKVTIAGQEYKILNQEVLTEYSSAKTTKYMVKMATYRKSVQEVFHLKDINEEQIVGYQESQIILKMKSHRRKGSQEVINALRNEVSGTEVIPTNTKKKRFFGMM